MRILVTGGAGFIGRVVVEQARAAGHDVRVLDSLRPDVHGADPGPPADLVVGDVRDAELLGSALRDTDLVIHLAAKVGLGVNLDDLDDYVASNDLGTAVLLQAMARRGVGRLVLAGSMVVYGEGGYRCSEDGPVRPGPRRPAALEAGRFEPGCLRCGRDLIPEVVLEDAPMDPRNGYAATKLQQEHLAAVWARQAGGTAAVLRFHNVYGPGMPQDTPYAGVAAIFRSALRAGRAPTVLEDGRQRRDFVHVRDVADAVLRAAGATLPAGSVRAYNVGSGEISTIGRLAEVMARVCGGPEPVVTGGYRLGDVRHITASSERAARELGWRAATSFEAGIAELAGARLRPAASG